MKKNIYIAFGTLIIIIFILWYFLGSNKTEPKKILVPVKTGEFRINVTTTGELEAKNSEKIFGPADLRSIRIWNVKIEDIIPDGTVVDSGEYVATLDRTEISNRIKDLESEVEKLESQHIKTKLDTTMDLRNARNELINLKYNLEERKIKLDQSKYEPPATIRQYEIELDKAQRDYEEAIKNYDLKLEKAEATMKEVTVTLEQQKRNLEQNLSVRDQFIIRAPKAGMVIYKRDWDGSKLGMGGTVSAWDNVVATLPDLSKMISRTYVNEIDISKVKTGQPVEIGVDAFPEKKYSGKVIEVANIGEQMRNSNAKVFEVKIEVNEYDSILRPAMTTKNTVVTSVIDSVMYVPIECIHSNDSITFVYTDKKTKQQVLTGESNENEVIIRAGLDHAEQIYLSPPEITDKFKLVTLDPDLLKKIQLDDARKKAIRRDSIKKGMPSDTGMIMPHEQMKMFRDKGGFKSGEGRKKRDS
jgi:multidrug efflux pump subunit AcrA (membrane-fusion protein)